MEFGGWLQLPIGPGAQAAAPIQTESGGHLHWWEN